MRKLAAVAVVGLTALGGVAATTQEAEARSRNGAVVAAGVIGFAAGAMLASSAAHAYHPGYAYAPSYGYGYGYAAPTYYAPVASYGYAAPIYAAPRVIVRHGYVAPRRVVHRKVVRHHGYPVRARTVVYRSW